MSPPLHLTRPLVVFDLETTGVDVAQDRIVEFAGVKLLPDGRREEVSHLVHPGRPIPPQATDVHGISDEQVDGCPRFRDVAAELAVWMADCDLAGFNVLGFDLPMLEAEFLRAGITWPSGAPRVVDAQVLFHLQHPRRLIDALRIYCDEEHVDAHAAGADVEATVKVLAAQAGAVAPEADQPTLEAMAALSMGDRVDWAGRFRRDAEGRIVFGFGKHQGQPADENLDYVAWMLTGTFPPSTKRVARELLAGRQPQGSGEAAPEPDVPVDPGVEAPVDPPCEMGPES